MQHTVTLILVDIVSLSVLLSPAWHHRMTDRRDGISPQKSPLNRRTPAIRNIDNNRQDRHRDNEFPISAGVETIGTRFAMIETWRMLRDSHDPRLFYRTVSRKDIPDHGLLESSIKT